MSHLCDSTVAGLAVQSDNILATRCEYQPFKSAQQHTYTKRINGDESLEWDVSTIIWGGCATKVAFERDVVPANQRPIREVVRERRHFSCFRGGFCWKKTIQKNNF